MKISIDIKKAQSILRQGGLVGIPTETVYGLGADACNAEAVSKIFSVKGRPSNHPLIVHIGNIEQLNQWAIEIPDVALKLAEKFWPGPLTMVLRRHPDVSDVVTGGLDTIAIRIPDHPLTLELLKKFGGGIAAPSANRYGRISPTSAEDVYEELGNQVDIVLDGGRCIVGIESTIIDCTTNKPVILRPGKITAQQISFLFKKEIPFSTSSSVQHPGNKLSHYAPDSEIRLVRREDIVNSIERARYEGKVVGLIATSFPHILPKDLIQIPIANGKEGMAHDLYHALRESDHLGVEVLVIVMPDEDGIGHALQDRLIRASRNNLYLKFRDIN